MTTAALASAQWRVAQCRKTVREALEEAERALAEVQRTEGTGG